MYMKTTQFYVFQSTDDGDQTLPEEKKEKRKILFTVSTRKFNEEKCFFLKENEKRKQNERNAMTG